MTEPQPAGDEWPQHGIPADVCQTDPTHQQQLYNQARLELATLTGVETWITNDPKSRVWARLAAADPDLVINHLAQDRLDRLCTTATEAVILTLVRHGWTPPSA